MDKFIVNRAGSTNSKGGEGNLMTQASNQINTEPNSSVNIQQSLYEYQDMASGQDHLKSPLLGVFSSNDNLNALN